jgi:hypothetical protein
VQRIRETDFLYSYEFVFARGVMLGSFSCSSNRKQPFKAAENSAALARLLF